MEKRKAVDMEDKTSKNKNMSDSEEEHPLYKKPKKEIVTKVCLYIFLLLFLFKVVSHPRTKETCLS